jgi:hypothetical protein
MLTPSARMLALRDLLTPEQEELFDFTYQFTPETALIFVGFAMSDAALDGPDLWRILAEFKKRYRQSKVIDLRGGSA